MSTLQRVASVIVHRWNNDGQWTCLRCRQVWPDPCACPCHDAVLCLYCGLAEYLTVRRWYMGHRACWWCGYCLDITPVLAVLDSRLGVAFPATRS